MIAIAIFVLALSPLAVYAQSSPVVPADVEHVFATSDNCIACHSNLSTSGGHDVSIGYGWRASMMANAARDPYWQAAVRREVTDHPVAEAAIEDKCSTCHMPMARYLARELGEQGKVFENAAGQSPFSELAMDGVSCTVCHQIAANNLGSEESFTGGFEIAASSQAERQIFGPHDVDAGRQHLMRSASTFLPATSTHLAQSQVCATCHTLYTHTLDEQGRELGELAEQVPYLEWLASDYSSTQSCQDCHMPEVDEDVAISSVLGEPRPAVSQHSFRGSNAFMLGILNRNRGELGVVALPQELQVAMLNTQRYLQEHAARVQIDNVQHAGSSLVFDVDIESLAGHKLPTAYPSRRAWLHVQVLDDDGEIIFESGAVQPDGSIAGNDNDESAELFESHYEQIDSPDQVQIYESIMADVNGEVTTSLLSGFRYIKDNRLLPRGFDKSSADTDIATFGGALSDDDFVAGGDRLTYRLESMEAAAQIRVELRYQTIAYRWAENLRGYDSFETNRFTRYYDDSAGQSSELLARDTRIISP